MSIANKIVIYPFLIVFLADTHISIGWVYQYSILNREILSHVMLYNSIYIGYFTVNLAVIFMKK